MSLPVHADFGVAEALLAEGGLGLEAVRAPHDGVDDDPPEDLALARLHPRCLGSEKREGEIREKGRNGEQIRQGVRTKSV